MRSLFVFLCVMCLVSHPVHLLAQPPAWGSYNANPQHTGVSTVPLQNLNVVKWSTPVDLNPQYTGSSLLIHYGSPLATAANTIVVPVKTGTNDTFRVEGRQGYDGGLMWTQSSDYTLPPHGWIPSYSPVITPQNRLYYPGEGGTILYRDSLDAYGNVSSNRLAFYGLSNYQGNTSGARSNVFINTPITSDASGNIYFGFQVTNTVTMGGTTLQAGGGIARISNTGVGSYVQASTAVNGDTTFPNIQKIVHSAAPALSNDGSTLYVAVTTSTGTGFSGNGYLLALNSTTLATTGTVALKDVAVPTNAARLPDSGSASPMVGPDGDVYFGVLENTGTNRSRGWMLHFDSTLTQTKIPGRFGWDNTASIISSSLVPSYAGTSPYLILTKYNNYASVPGGDGKNRMGIFDPFNSEADEYYGKPVASKVIDILGITPDSDFPGVPGAVREWCINSAAVDPFHKWVLVNNEDGKSYIWDLASNTLTNAIILTSGIGEAYTPTVIGPDGTGYAINNGILFAMAATAVPEPGTIALCLVGLAAGGFTWRSHCRRQRQLANAELQG